MLFINSPELIHLITRSSYLLPLFIYYTQSHLHPLETTNLLSASMSWAFWFSGDWWVFFLVLFHFRFHIYMRSYSIFP